MCNFYIEKVKRRKGGNCDALLLEGLPTSHQSFWAVFGQICTTHVQRLYHFRAVGQTFDTTVGFRNPDFPYGTDILAIG